MIAEKAGGNLSAVPLAAKNLDQLFELETHLMDELLALIQIDLCLAAREAITGTANRKALLIQEAADLPNDQDVLTLVIAAIAAPFDRLELRKFLLPVAKHVRLDPAQIAHFVDLFFEEIRAALSSGEQVKLSGFGNFDLRDKNRRPGRNPKTGEEIPISARRVVTFRPGQKLKARVEAYAGTKQQ